MAVLLPAPAELGDVGSDVGRELAAGAVLRTMTEGRRSAATQLAYEGDLRKFFAWRGCEVSTGAVSDLCRSSAGEIAIVLTDYASSMRVAALAEATSNRRLSAVRSLLRTARRFGLTDVDPAGLAPGEKVVAYRDTRGPGVDGVVKLLADTDRSRPIGIRDYAIIVLLFENALRRAELLACDVSDFDAGGLRLSIIGKGKGTQKIPVTLSARCAEALSAYLSTRGFLLPCDPLFVSAARCVAAGSRLTGDGLYHIMRTHGVSALGRRVNPHAMRHASITAFLDASGGDLRTAKKLSRHERLVTLEKYDDNRSDLQGVATRALSILV